ncbi:MAG: Stage III sporulation protein AB [Brockia lithotrophica]|uniref:Stage III sporulation protein AB n=1 Tax=Brockia lithotrophica TaxID=933949 RepID=A0A2T5G687_9BACL|nr:stage III sporulation protein AB [Brockia lithotrophica]MBT9252392.1 stage III sporulation protein AB [Brockia lithotrophica]MBT9252764.1 stage III sporulation protein AB [Brockia lithotrophica]PTQ51693.1 MAG: Stage III sporulation protein AB [Brockia lithotrophica]
MKPLLFFALSLCGAGIGWSTGERYRRRTRLLGAFRQAFLVLELEVLVRRVPLPEVARELSAEGPEELRGFFADLARKLADGARSFGEAWEGALEPLTPHLREADQRLLRAAGSTLGRGDVEHAARVFHRTDEELARRIEEALEEERRYVGLYRNLGFLGGLALGILVL